ncbi:MAG: hypothetical protein IKR89_12235 [Bacteroidaceae bacterium]|nr:hypothetical protein [Bacteroidaceae bacterium]
MDRLFLLVIAVSLAFGVGCLGRKRRIGFGWAFAISLFNVILGLIVVLCSKKKDSIQSAKRNVPKEQNESFLFTKRNV